MAAANESRAACGNACSELMSAGVANITYIMELKKQVLPRLFRPKMLSRVAWAYYAICGGASKETGWACDMN